MQAKRYSAKGVSNTRIVLIVRINLIAIWGINFGAFKLAIYVVQTVFKLFATNSKFHNGCFLKAITICLSNADTNNSERLVALSLINNTLDETVSNLSHRITYLKAEHIGNTWSALRLEFATAILTEPIFKVPVPIITNIIRNNRRTRSLARLESLAKRIPINGVIRFLGGNACALLGA
ncbi:hypothetical protein B597_012645 [Stutzerimonas stutzeri KOS6]|uniref:Uncharacterized protein n=1 Tax=Stutzerimonas stutzeri KOS6 TaxID=1218352 RepID=A0A061JMA1_STUST|nr:hypothetical protein B597_012645 [Stutzerimonas stutzeri KOS6]